MKTIFCELVMVTRRGGHFSEGCSRESLVSAASYQQKLWWVSFSMVLPTKE